MTKLDKNFAPRTFDVVIDKAAMDALMVDEGDVWCPDDPVVTAAHEMLSGISTALRDDGVMFQISLTQPHFRVKYLNGEHAKGKERAGEADGGDCNFEICGGSSEDCYGWKVTSQTIGGEDGGGFFHHYLYSCIKKKNNS